MGWVTSAHGALYAQEYGWDITFEALVAKITAEFIENFDPARERCWIAEIDGERVGSVFVVRKTDEIAKLRLLIIDPQRPRARARQAAGRRMPALREGRRLYVDDAVDAEHPDRGARHLSARRIQARSPRSRIIRSASISSAKPGTQSQGPRSLNRTALAVLAAAITGVQVGAAITATRYVAADISPASLAFLRYAIGVACLLPAARAGARMRFARADILPIALLGIGQFGVLIALLNYGLQTVPAGRGALIFATFPLLTLVVAAIARP